MRHGSCYHSSIDRENPWWSVDLKDVYNIKHVDIYSRTDFYSKSQTVWTCCGHVTRDIAQAVCMLESC